MSSISNVTSAPEFTPSTGCYHRFSQALGRVWQWVVETWKTFVEKVCRCFKSIRDRIAKLCENNKKLFMNGDLVRYACEYSKQNKLNVCVLMTGDHGMGQMDEIIETDPQKKYSLPRAFAFFPLISSKTLEPDHENPKLSHFYFVYICLKNRTIELYDSLLDYGPHNAMIDKLTDLSQKLDRWIPGGKPFEVQIKMKKKLQQDGYQCGAWVLYFFKKRAKNDEVDFNKLDVDEAQKMIANQRLKFQKKIDAINMMQERAG